MTGEVGEQILRIPQGQQINDPFPKVVGFEVGQVVVESVPINLGKLFQPFSGWCPDVVHLSNRAASGQSA